MYILKLPKIEFDGKAACCNNSHVDTYLDHANDAHGFSLTGLAWAIQNGVNVETVERYLKRFHPSAVKTELCAPISTHIQAEKIPILFFAVQRNSSDIVRALCEAGADPGQRLRPAGMPILAYTVISSEYDLSDKTDTLLALLAKGANPRDIPYDMWEAPLKAPKGDMPPAPPMGQFQAIGWCSSETRKALARNLLLAHRYLLWRAERLVFREPRQLQISESLSILPLLEIPFHIVGQTYAINQVIRTITSHFLFEGNCPLVLLFTGPSGHGKTELAKQMGRLLSLDIHSVDCTEMKHETDIFGPKFPYRGYEQGSHLNNFLASHAGDQAVVFLDEFDKTTKEVREAMLLPFDSGEYMERRCQEKLDISKIIWILAANFGETEIRQYWSSHIEGRPESSQGSERYDELSQILGELLINSVGAPLIGRLSGTIPFFPFNDLEKSVATYKFMRELRNEVRKPIDIQNKLFPRHIDLEYHDDGRLARHLAQSGYVVELGARSLKNIVTRQIIHRLVHVFLLEKAEIHDEMNQGPLEAYEARLVSTEHDEHEVVLNRSGERVIVEMDD